MATKGNNLMKELHSLFRKANKLYDGQVECEFYENEQSERKESEQQNEDREVEGQKEEGENVREKEDVKFYVYISPNEGLYKGVRCIFLVRVELNEYPNYPPVVQCLTKIYHPNIDTSEYNETDAGSNVCVSLLTSDWQPEVGLDGCVMALLYLFHHPEWDDALSPVCCNFDDEKDFETRVRMSLQGKEVDGHLYTQFIESDEDELEVDDEKVVTTTESETNPTREENIGEEAENENENENEKDEKSTATVMNQQEETENKEDGTHLNRVPRSESYLLLSKLPESELTVADTIPEQAKYTVIQNECFQPQSQEFENDVGQEIRDPRTLTLPTVKEDGDATTIKQIDLKNISICVNENLVGIEAGKNKANSYTRSVNNWLGKLRERWTRLFYSRDKNINS